ncbi:MAG: arylsulfatase, partial [Planctomycetaceae bacterium]|nr:arylsulfatase [Planctomycetaceae bacterium]
MADDMGYGDVGCYNAESKISTPHMDRLAGQGMRFTDAHTPSSVCTPTRYGLLTGRYCWRSRLKNSVLWGFDHPLIEKDRETIASLLKRHGYATASVGKWHLGLGWTTRDGNKGPWPDRSKNEPHAAGWGIDYATPLRGGPNTLGFDYFFGIAASNNMPPYCFIEDDRVVGNPNIKKTPLNYGNTTAPMVAGWDDSQYGPNFTEKAVAFIDQHQAKQSDEPFFLYFPSQAPHRPCVPPDFVRGKSQAGRRGDMVIEFDWSVGQILKTLQRHKLTENTIVLVTSDNGATPGDTFPPKSKKRNGNILGETFGHKSCGDWRGYKSQIWEGGHRVPLIVRWPGQVERASVSHELVCLTDLISTVADVLDAKLPTEAGPDSVSFLPALLGKQPANSSDKAVIHHDYSGRFSIRQGDWKYVAPFAKARRGAETGALLFNLRADPAEKKNVIADNAEVAKRLAGLLARYQTADHSR